MRDDMLDFNEPECLAGVHCMGCGLKYCPINEKGQLMSDEEFEERWPD